MASDEAVIRIVLQDEGGEVAPPAPQQTPSANPQTPQTPQQTASQQPARQYPPQTPVPIPRTPQPVPLPYPVVHQAPKIPPPATAPDPKQATPPPDPRPSTPPKHTSRIDDAAVEGYQAIARAVNLARHDADAFGKSMEGVHGKLFQMRHGVDPQAIANIFKNGGEASQKLLKNLVEINSLVGQGVIGQGERVQLVKREISGTSSDPTKTATEAVSTTGPNPAWVDRLVEGVEGANRHVLIEGMSGSGKSVMARNIAFQRMQQGEEVHVVDPGHGSSNWKGAASVFGAETAGADAADFIRQTLESRKAQKEETEQRTGKEMTQADFKPMTIVLSDFKKLLQDYPKLANEVNAMLQEGRKFNVAVLAEAASMSGIKGVASMLPNFAQKVKMGAEVGATGNLERKAVIGGKEFATPDLPDFKDKFDPSIVRKPAPTPAPPPPPPPSFDPVAEATKRREAERRSAQVRAAYKEKFGEDDGESTLDRVLDVAGKFRGAIGGFAGALIGIGLDAVASFRRAQVEVQSKRRDADLLAEIPTPMPAQAEPVVTPVPPLAAEVPTEKTPVEKIHPAEIPPQDFTPPIGNISPTMPQAPPAAPPQAPPAPAAPAASGAKSAALVGVPAAPKVPAAVPVAQAAAPAAIPVAKTAASAAGAATKAAGTAASATVGAAGATGAASGTLSAIGPMLTNPVGIAVAAVVALGLATKLVADQMSATTQRLADYNGALSAATARAEARQIQGDIRRGQEAAPVLSKFTDAQSQLSERSEDLKIQFMNSVGPAVTEMLNAANMVVQLLTASLKGIQIIVGLINSVPLIADVLRILGEAWEWVKRRFGIADDNAPNDGLNIILQDLFANIDF